MHARNRYLLVALLFLPPVAASGQGPDTLMFGTTHEPGSVVYGYASEYLQLLCAEIRQRCTLQSLPGRRGAAMLASGALAGEVGRVETYRKQHPEYRRVEEPFVGTRTFVFTRNDSPVVDRWEELGHKVVTVSYRRGVYIFQTRLEALRPHVQAHDVQTVEACLRMVLTWRDQACIFDDGSLTAESRALLAQGHTGKSLDTQQLYIYLGKDHAVLAADMTAAARQLSARGVKDRLRRKYFDPRGLSAE